MNNTTYISATEAAKLAGVTSETIRTLCKAGTLSYQLHGRNFHPLREDVEKYAQTYNEVHVPEMDVEEYYSEKLFEREEARAELEATLLASDFLEYLRLYINYASKNFFSTHQLREAEILKRRVAGKSHKEIGDEFGLTEERTRQILGKGMRRWSCSGRSETKIREYEIEELKTQVETLKAILRHDPPKVKTLPEDVKELLKKTLSECDFSIRTINCLTDAQIITVDDLVRNNRADLLKLRNFGHRSLVEIDEWLEQHGLSYGMTT